MRGASWQRLGAVAAGCAVVGGAVLLPRVAVRAADGDPELRISDGAPRTLSEGTAGATATFTITLSRPAVIPVRATVALCGGASRQRCSASPVGDVEGPRSSQVQLLPGQTSAQISVRVLPDDHPEGDEVLTADVTYAEGAEIARATGVLTIVDDDPMPVHDVRPATSFPVVPATSSGAEVAWHGDVALVGAGPGGQPTVGQLDASGLSRSTDLAFPAGFRGGARPASCDLDGDGHAESIVVAAGPGGGPHVRTLGLRSRLEAGFFAYASGFGGGVFVACGDVDGDGRDEIVTAPGAGGGPNVRVFDGDGRLLSSFMAEDPRFLGGLRVGVLPGVGVVTGAGAGGGPVVRVLSPGGEQRAAAFCFDPAYSGGTTVAVGDADGDAAVDVLCGSGRGTSHVVALTAGLRPHPSLRPFFAAPGGSPTDGVRLAVGPAGTQAGIVAASGPGRAAALQLLVARVRRPDRDRLLARDVQAFGVGVLTPAGEQEAWITAASSPMAISPDRRRAAYRWRTGVVVSEVDGAGQRTVLADAAPHLAWADRAEVLVGVTSAGTAFATSPEGAGERRSARIPEVVGEVDVTPDGSTLLLRTDRGLRRWPTSAAGQAPSLVLARAEVRAAGISPDGARVAYCTDQGLRVVGLDGAGDRELAAGFCDEVRWSPDGSVVAVGRPSYSGEGEDGLRGSALAVVRVADGAIRDLPGGPGVHDISWSPSGGRLAAVAYSWSPAHSSAYVVDVASGATTYVGGGKYGTDVEW